MTRSGMLRAVVLAALVLAVTLGAMARPPKPAAPKDPRPRALTRHEFNYREWTVAPIVRLFAYQFRTADNEPVAPTSPTELDEVSMVYPLIPGSAMHDAYLDRMTSKMTLGNRKLDLTPRTLPNYQGGTMLGVWDAKSLRSTEPLTLRVDIPMTSYETRIDEDIAMTYEWPTGPYKPMIASCLEPQLFVEPGHPAIIGLVNEWTKGKPKKAKPYYLAKYLAGRVVEHFRPTEGMYHATGRGPQRGQITAVLISGFNVNGAAYAAIERRGSRYDMACLLTAVYRAAGLPARMVIGVDITESEEKEFTVLHAWTEFYLYDEKAEAGEWIPVDVYRQSQFSSRSPPIDQRWQHFGHSEESDFYAPLAYHWLPPTSVTNAGAMGIWGWVPQPAVPRVDAELKFIWNGTPRRGDDPKEWWERPKQQPMQ